MAEESDERPCYLVNLGYVFGGTDHPGEETQTCAEHSNQVPPWRRRLRYVPGGIFHHSGGTQTNGGELNERCCRLGGIAFVISPPESTSRTDESNACEEIERSVTSVAAPSRFSQRIAPSRRNKNLRPHIK